MGPASDRTEGGEAARGNDFVLVDGDGRAEMATAWVSASSPRVRTSVMPSIAAAKTMVSAPGAALALATSDVCAAGGAHELVTVELHGGGEAVVDVVLAPPATP